MTNEAWIVLIREDKKHGKWQNIWEMMIEQFHYMQSHFLSSIRFVNNMQTLICGNGARQANERVELSSKR